MRRINLTETQSMKIYEILKKDHLHTKTLLKKLLKVKDDDHAARDQLVEAIRLDLVPHARAEEAVFYNPLREMDAGNDQVMHGYKEHMEAEALLRSLQVLDSVNADWKETAKKLEKALVHHMNEEETKLFKIARRHIDDSEAEIIGAAFLKLKPEIANQGVMSTTADMLVNMMPPRMSKFLGLGTENPISK